MGRNYFRYFAIFLSLIPYSRAEYCEFNYDGRTHFTRVTESGLVRAKQKLFEFSLGTLYYIPR